MRKSKSSCPLLRTREYRARKKDCLAYFYPFNKPDFKKNGIESGWSVTDREGIAITMAMGVHRRLLRWIAEGICGKIRLACKGIYRLGISAFGGIAPTYWIALEKDSPVIIWDFHSLLVMVQMGFSFMLTDKDSDMRMCKHCKKAFVASRKEKHKTDAVYGWYRYNIRFALPVYDDKIGKVARHNIYSASMLVRHANDGRKYLYDILAIKKETSSPLE